LARKQNAAFFGRSDLTTARPKAAAHRNDKVLMLGARAGIVAGALGLPERDDNCLSTAQALALLTAGM